MTFPLEFDLLMIGVCTFIQKKKRQKQKQKKDKKNKNKKKQKLKDKKKKKDKKNKKKRQKKNAKIRLCLISHSSDFFFVVGFISEGLSEIFMRDELRESSMRSFVPWIMTDMYLI